LARRTRLAANGIGLTLREMNPERWRKISEIFEAALERPADERASFLADACAGDEELRQRVEAMLAADNQRSLLIDRPAYQALSNFSTIGYQFEAQQSLSGAMIGEYRLIKELARGGMGKVYIAFDTRLGRTAALKVLPTQTASPERVVRFQREARTASSLNHPNIITIYDFGNANGRDFIVSEYVEGRTLRSFIADPDLSFNKILDIVIQVASALEAAHTAGIVHRDVKPENIMVRPDGYVKVLDFGLAKLTEQEPSSDDAVSDSVNTDFETRPGTLLGTFKYMSPEQARGQKVDPRSDLFSLGIILYELVTGNLPFKGETLHHTMVSITDSNPPPIADVVEAAPDGLQEIISRALAKNRDDRYQSARELLNDLKALRIELAEDARIQRTKSKPAPAPVTASQASTLSALEANASTQTKSFAASASPKLSWVKVAAVVAAVFLAAFAAYFYGRGWRPTPTALTNKDTILLADFVNNTGDPVFDNTLKQGLAVQLAQSPYLNLLPEERARETLTLMERSRDEKITREIAREICQRRGIKALLIGTIASLGRNYVITLEAVSSQSGETIAHQQTEAEGKEQVLKALGRASTAMREQLGESLASISKFDAPIEQATTASLDALKDFAAGLELRRKGQYAQSVPPFKRAIDQDGEFALAYLQLGNSLRDMRNYTLGNQNLKRAYELRDRVSERERLEISATYFRYITGELDKRIETTELLSKTYSQNPESFHIHGNSLMIAGQFERAAQAYRSALGLDPDFSLSRANLALALIGLNRFDDARDVIKEGVARGLESSGFHNRLFLIAFVKGDQQEASLQAESFAGKPDEYQMIEIQARSYAFEGRRREAIKEFEKAAEIAAARGLPAERARILSNEANLNALVGYTAIAHPHVDRILFDLGKENVGPEELLPSLIQQLDAPGLGWTLALCGDSAGAQSIADQISQKAPLDTMQNSVWLPLIRATSELKRGSESDQAIQSLQAARQYEGATFFKPEWIRAQAYLQAKNGSLAAAEFQKIIDHRGWDSLSTLWRLAHLGLARALALQGDVSKSRQAYEAFFQLWKSADSDLPLLLEAKREFARLK
jgi:eukaryotic-like serine/threonine-protein kinase